MFKKQIIMKTSDNQYLCYDEEDTGWYLSLSKNNIVKFDGFYDFELTYSKLESTVLHGHTEFSTELVYTKEQQ